MLIASNTGQNIPSYKLKNKDYTASVDFKTPVHDVYSGSVQQNTNKEKLSFKAFIDLFVKRDPVVILKELARDAQLHSRPLENSIHRFDYKEIIPKNTIIEILEAEKSKAKMLGKKEDYDRLIKVVNEEY